MAALDAERWLAAREGHPGNSGDAPRRTAEKARSSEAAVLSARPRVWTRPVDPQRQALHDALPREPSPSAPSAA